MLNTCSGWKGAFFICAVTPLLTMLSPCRSALAEEPPKVEVKKSELRNSMETIDEDMKKLRRSIRKAEQNADSLTLITEIQTLLVAGKAMPPEKMAKLPEADREKFLAAYRKEMAAVIVEMCNLETALLDGDNAKAQEIYTAITTREDKDHDQFMQKDEKK